MEPELIFVYNAKSGKMNAYLDTLHKIISPKTYACSLCAITYGNFGMREEWANYIGSLNLPLTFLHKDEWESQFERKDSLPVIFLKEGDNISTFLDSEQLNQFSLSDLISFIDRELKSRKLN